MIDPTLTDGYIGPNLAHQVFKQRVVNAKMLLFAFQRNLDHLNNWFQTNVDDARRRAGGDNFSIGIITEVLSNTQMRLLNIPGNEARLVAGDFGHFARHVYETIYTNINRVLVDFLIDLYAEIGRADPRILRSNKTLTFEEVIDTPSVLELIIEKQRVQLSHAGRDELAAKFTRIGLPLLPEGLPANECEFLDRESRLLWATRNILEHNQGVVNDLFLKQCPNADLKRGDLIRIDVALLGKAFASAEGLADNLNRRAVEKFTLSEN